MISLKDLLQIPRFSDLKLLTESELLNDAVIGSVEITETPDVAKFIPENVFILTTAMVFQDNQEELISFIDSLIESDAIGLGIKVGRFLYKVDEEVIAYANKVKFPILLIPDRYPLGSLLHQIMNQVLETEREEIDFALDIQKRFSDLLVQGASNHRLVREFSRMIHSQILLLNPLGQIISHSQHFKNHKAEAEFYVEKIFNERKKTNRDAGSFIVTERDGSTTHLALIEINVYTYFPHYLVIVHPEKVPYPTSIFAFEQAGLVFLFNLHKNQKINEAKYANESHFFNDVLNNQSREAYIESNWLSVSRNYGYVQSNYYQVIHISSQEMVGEINNSSTLQINERLFLSYLWLRQNIKDYFPHGLIIWREEAGEMILLIQDEPENLTGKLSQLSDQMNFLLNSQLIFSIGRSFSDWYQMEQSYTQAKLAYNERQKAKVKEPILYYRDNGVEQLFNQLNQNEIVYFCKSVLKELAYPTEDSKIDLRETLDTYLKNQGEITQTSNELFIHRNTVKYRINRCEEILGVKVDDPEVSLNLRLAIELSKTK